MSHRLLLTLTTTRVTTDRRPVAQPGVTVHHAIRVARTMPFGDSAGHTGGVEIRMMLRRHRDPLPTSTRHALRGRSLPVRRRAA